MMVRLNLSPRAVLSQCILQCKKCIKKIIALPGYFSFSPWGFITWWLANHLFVVSSFLGFGSFGISHVTCPETVSSTVKAQCLACAAYAFSWEEDVSYSETSFWWHDNELMERTSLVLACWSSG
jgi:hypothetical protein